MRIVGPATPRASESGCSPSLHLEGRHARAQGVILLRQRRTEQGDETVAEQLADGAAEGFDGIDQQLQRLVEIVAGFFRIGVLQKIGRIADIHEQHAHLLVLRQHPRRTSLRQMKERRTLVGSAVQTGAALRAIAMLAGYASRANRTGRHDGTLQSCASTKELDAHLRRHRLPPEISRSRTCCRPLANELETAVIFDL